MISGSHKYLTPRRTVALGATVAMLFMGGCGAPPPPANAMAADVLALGKENRWPEAMPLAKHLVLAWPDAPGGHYLLGKAYLHRPDPQLLHAEGEFKTALALHRRSGSLDAVLEPNANAFLLALYRDLALVDFRWIREAMGFNLPPAVIRDKLLEARQHVEKGLAINPQDSFLLEMQTTVREYLDGPFKNVPTLTPPQPSGAILPPQSTAPKET